MKLFGKRFTLNGLENISAKFIENFIESLGFKPLRYAVVKIKDDEFTVDSVVIKE